jgi:Lon protease-like protein
VTTTHIPLFPLSTVLFPGGSLPLRIFERRYIDMVRDCSANGSCFGVVLLTRSSDGGQVSFHARMGTTARIFDFSTLDDGLLGIATRGEQRFVIRATSMRDSGLLMGDVDLINDPGPVDVPEQFSVLSLVAGKFMEQLGERYPDFSPAQLEDADWVSYRLSELLPLENEERQALLQIDDPLERLQVLLDTMPRFQEAPEA